MSDITGIYVPRKSENINIHLTVFSAVTNNGGRWVFSEEMEFSLKSFFHPKLLFVGFGFERQYLPIMFSLTKNLYLNC